MHGYSTSLETERDVALPGILCLTGGGGKTGLLFALGRAFAAAGKTVLCTTTTRMYRPLPAPWFAMAITDDPATIPALDAGMAVFAAKNAPPGADAAKVHGYAPEDIDALYRRGAASRIVVEADGAAGRPLKAPAAHEPVIPGMTRTVIALIGLSCLGRPFGPETVFRPDRVTAITGLLPGDTVTPAALAALAVHPEGLFKNTPSGASRLLFCNQADIPGSLEAVRHLALILNRDHPGFLRGLYCGALQTEGLRCLALPVA